MIRQQVCSAPHLGMTAQLQQTSVEMTGLAGNWSAVVLLQRAPICAPQQGVRRSCHLRSSPSCTSCAYKSSAAALGLVAGAVWSAALPPRIWSRIDALVLSLDWPTCKVLSTCTSQQTAEPHIPQHVPTACPQHTTDPRRCMQPRNVHMLPPRPL